VEIFFVVFFPNVRWVPTILWVSSLVLVPITFGYALFVAARAALKLVVPARPPATDKPRPNHFKSRRKWLFGVGVGMVFILLLLTFIEQGLKSSTVYELSVEKADASPGVIGALGQPIHAGWFVFGQITESSNGSGQATLAIPLHGPKGKGKLDVEAIRQTGSWRFSVLRFVADGRAVDLLEEKAGRGKFWPTLGGGQSVFDVYTKSQGEGPDGTK
jgi:hypothetical protein